MTLNDRKKTILKSVATTLIEKNKRYGNAALSPIGVFYKGDATNSICIRLDDKLSRISNSEILRKNDLFDLLGYCLLLKIDHSYNEFHKKIPFEQKVNETIQSISIVHNTEIAHVLQEIRDVTICSFNGFTKEDNKGNLVIKSLNYICSVIKDGKEEFDYYYLTRLIVYLVEYFVEKDITNFEDLID